MSNHNQHLGVNRLGKNIRKSPIHQPNPQPPQPQVYNINKNDFRSVVQQLTGTPSRDPSPNPPPPPPRPLPPPAAAAHRPTSNRLQRIRPPPLAPIARPSLPNHQGPILNRPPAPPPSAFPPTPPSLWAGVAESPISAYMRYLENSVLNPEQMQGGRPVQGQMVQNQPQLRPPGPQHMPFPGPGGFKSPRGAGPPPPLSPSSGLLPSPSAFLNLLSPHPPYPLTSPRFQLPSPLAHGFFPSTMSHSGGILGPGPGQLPPPSPGLVFPPSPSWFLPSPKWRDM